VRTSLRSVRASFSRRAALAKKSQASAGVSFSNSRRYAVATGHQKSRATIVSCICLTSVNRKSQVKAFVATAYAASQIFVPSCRDEDAGIGFSSSVGAPIRTKGGAVRFHSLQTMRADARIKDRLEIAFTLGALAAIVVLLIGGSRLLVSLLAY
jgi:hypothetical protein